MGALTLSDLICLAIPGAPARFVVEVCLCDTTQLFVHPSALRLAMLPSSSRTSALDVSHDLLLLLILFALLPISLLQPTHTRLASLRIPHKERIQVIRRHHRAQGNLLDVFPVCARSNRAIVVRCADEYR